MQEAVISISHLVHLIATVIWIGGLSIFVLLVWPATRRTIKNPTESRQIILDLQRRFRPLANLSLVLLLGTGMIQMSVDPNYKGFLTFTNTWTVAMLGKHLAFGGMVVLTIIIQFGLSPAVQRAALLAARGETAELDRLLQRETRLSHLMLGLGLLVLLFTAIATAL